MVALSTVGLIIAAASFLTFVIIFGRTPLLRKGPIGALQRLLTEKLPHTLQNLDHVLTNGQLGRILARLNQYVLYEGNPIILCIFLLVLSVSIYLFVQATYTTLPLNHRLVVPLIVATPYILTYLCVTSTASYITRTNHRARSLDYPYDHALFKPGISCGTCKWTKPARSKHCSFCRACVSKCDHHCPWVNNCLGRDNYRWFLALLLSLGVLTYYGSYLAFCQLWPVVHNKPSEFKWNTRPYWDQIGSEAARAFEIGGLSISGVGLLAFLTAPLPWSFLAYHAYLLWAGMTTNESQKWSDMRDDMLDGSVFRCKRSEIPGLGPDDPHVPWPVSSDQAVVWTSDGRPPDGQEGIFERIWDLGAVDNIYDLGIWDNMMHVLQGR